MYAPLHFITLVWGTEPMARPWGQRLKKPPDAGSGTTEGENKTETKGCLPPQLPLSQHPLLSQHSSRHFVQVTSLYLPKLGSKWGRSIEGRPGKGWHWDLNPCFTLVPVFFLCPGCLLLHFTWVKQRVAEHAPTCELSFQRGGDDSGRLVGACMWMGQVIKRIRMAESLVHLVIRRSNLNE